MVGQILVRRPDSLPIAHPSSSMTARFDNETSELHLSVADLLERDAARSLGFANRGGFERLWVGQAIHSQYQERAMQSDSTYQREVALKASVVHRGWTVHIRGRADGIRSDGDLTVIEELKSVRPNAPIAQSTMEMYQRQARLYAWMHQRSDLDPSERIEREVPTPNHGADQRNGQGNGQGNEQDDSGKAMPPKQGTAPELVLIEIGSENDTGTGRHRLSFDAALFELQVRRQINGLLADHYKQRDEQLRRQEAGAALEFPFHTPRPGQQSIIDDVSRALEQREHLLVEAPTGLGKTAAALFPVLRHALQNDLRVYVLTAKNLQQRMATRVLDLLNRDGGFRSLQMRAKGRMCANGEVLCHEEYCSYARDYFGKLQQSRVLDTLYQEHPHLAPDIIFEAAKRATVCPFEVSLELGRRAQAVVCDYNYAFDPYVGLSDFSAEGDLSNTILVIDEIHNLVPRGRGYYSPTLSAADARKAAEQISHNSLGASALIGARLERLSLDLAEVIEDAVDGEIQADALPRGQRDLMVEASFPEEQLWALRPAFDRLFVEYLEHRRETKSFRPEDPFVQLYFDLLRFFNTMVLSSAASDSSFSHCHERSGNDRRLRILCKDASKYLGAIINRCHSVVGLSATLSPNEFYRDLLGFDEARTVCTSEGNPFPADHRKLAIDATVSTKYRDRQSHYQRIADRLGAFADAVPGNCLALFPSYAFLAEVDARLPQLPNKRTLIQQRADTEAQRNQILETLENELFGQVLLLAVAGGVFAEGVDYPGDMLKAVVVISPCLPSVSLEQKLLQNYFDERFDRGFEYSFVVPGMTRVVQAAGRLIRSSTDRGVIVLMGKRFRSKLYQRHMPRDWRDSLNAITDGREGGPAGGQTDGEASDPASIARTFFADHDT